VSNYKAIGAVTQTLINLISQNINTDLGIPSNVVSEYPEKFFKRNDNAINVHLYHIKESGSYKNNFLPHRNTSGDKTNISYLCLELFYTICVRSDEFLNNDLMLGYAILRLFENPILDKTYFQNNIENLALFTDVNISNDNFESIKISMENLTVDEASKVWSIIGKNYSLSAYYKVTVLLMRNVHEIKDGLPVKEVMISVSPKENIAINSIEKVKE